MVESSSSISRIFRQRLRDYQPQPNPPEAADPVRFAVPLGSHRSETPGKPVRGPDWATMDRVGGGLDVLIRHAPHRPGRGAAGQQPEAMPSPDPAPLEPADASPPPTGPGTNHGVTPTSAPCPTTKHSDACSNSTVSSATGMRSLLRLYSGADNHVMPLLEIG